MSWLDPAVVILVGGGLFELALGTYSHVGRNPENFWFFRATRIEPAASGEAFIVSLIPWGITLLIAGIALGIARNPVSRALLYASAVTGCFALVAMLWRPNWLRPRWLRTGS